MTTDNDSTSAVIPKGISYRCRPDRKDKSHQFGVWDGAVRKYRRSSFSDYAKGLAWAKSERRAMDRGEATALRPLLSEIGPLYIARLRTRGSNAAYVQQVEEIITQLRALGANDLNCDSFATRVQSWLDGMKSYRRKAVDAPPAAPRTKRRRLTITRALCHFAMKAPGRPLRFDPLLTIAVPRIERHDKPVFSIEELRSLVGQQSRSLARRQREEVERALEETKGNKVAASRLLGCHFATVHNRLKSPCHDDPWWVFSCLAIYLGARPSEVQHVQWEWVYWNEETIHIPADAPGNKMRLERMVPLQPELLTILRDIHKPGATGYLLPPDVVKLGHSDRAKSFKHYLRRCGIDPAGRGPHSLRHNHGALCVAMRMHPGLLMLNMGHDNPKVSHDYSRTAPRFRREVIGWGEEFYLRRDPPVPNLIQANVIPSISHDGTSPA